MYCVKPAVIDRSFALRHNGSLKWFMTSVRIVVALSSLVPIWLCAQVDCTAITGTVSDPQGNRIPQCSVRATDNRTGFKQETRQNFLSREL